MPWPGAAVVLLALLHVAPAFAQAPDEVFDEEASAAARATKLAALRAEAAVHLERATTLFREIGDLGASSAGAAAIRGELQGELARSRELALAVADADPDAEGWSDEHLAKVDSLSFWVRRLSPVDLTAPAADERWEDDEPDGVGGEEEPDAGTGAAVAPRPTYTPETLPIGVVPLAGTDCQSLFGDAEAARAKQPARAIYRYLAASQCAGANEELQVRAHEALEALRDEIIVEQIVDYLDEEMLRSENPLLRVFAAGELGELGRAQAVKPLVTALEREQDPVVVARIQQALEGTPRGAAARALGRLASGKRPKLAPLVIETLTVHVGGRPGADALGELALHEDAEIWRPALKGIEQIGGEPASAALGRITRDRKLHPKLMQETIQALAALRLASAAEPLVPHLKRKGKFLFPAGDGLVALGEHAIPALVRALSSSSLRGEANECLRRISGLRLAPNADVWRDWYRRWVSAGRSTLPCLSREGN